MRILHVEDNSEIILLVARILAGNNYVVENASTIEAASEALFVEEYDLVILDRRINGTDGLEFCREIRQSGSPVPVLILSVLGDPEERMTGLDLGADDYLPKPFHEGEFLARVQALLRRGSSGGQTEIVIGDLRLNPGTRQVHRGTRAVELLPKEFAILEYLMRNPGLVRSKEQIGENVWGVEYDPRSNIIESYISRLRRKIERPGAPELIRTLRNAGYSIRTEGT